MLQRSEISLDRRYLEKIVNIFEEYLHQHNVKLYLIGSRARGFSHETSDVDLFLEGDSISGTTLATLREVLHESHIPYKIDLIEYHHSDQNFRNSITKHKVLIWKN